MIESLRGLLRIQSLDGQLKVANEALDALSRERETAEAARARERAAAEAARNPVDETDRAHRQMERELAEAEALLAKLDVQKYEVTSKQAFAGFEREIAAATETKSDLEDRILEQLDVLEEARSALAKAEESIAEGERQGADEEASRSAREAEQRAVVEQLEAKRAEECGGIDRAALTLYERVRGKHWPALMLVADKTCPGCWMALVPQKLNDIRRGETVEACLYCGRILYGDKV